MYSGLNMHLHNAAWIIHKYINAYTGSQKFGIIAICLMKSAY